MLVNECLQLLIIFPLPTLFFIRLNSFSYSLMESIISKDKPLDIDVVKVEGGSFMMGQPAPNIVSLGLCSDEQPVHEVQVSTFYISQYLVTLMFHIESNLLMRCYRMQKALLPMMKIQQN